MRQRALICSAFLCLYACEPSGKPPVSAVPGATRPEGVEEILGALTVGGCECPSWQPGVKCADITYSDIPPDNKYYVTTFGGPGDSQDMWICGHKTTDNGSWPYAAGYARFGCGKIKVINPANGKSCIAEVADCGPNRCVEEAACFCNCQGHHPVLDVSPFITKYLFGISSSGWSEKRVVVAYLVDPSTPIGCPGGPEPTPDADGDGYPANVDCNDQDPSIHPGASERCNDKDDDCDGKIDEDFPLKGQPCDGPDGDDCKEGVFKCSNGSLVCSDNSQTNKELCNNLDDDCDGQTDEDFPLKGKACDGPDEDLCEEGTYACKGDGTGVECSDTSGTNEEQCNNLDDDCDGLTDEDLIRPCESLCGQGSERCEAGLWTGCDNPEPVHCVDYSTCQEVLACACGGPPPELCNGLDDDCDGLTDEGFEGLHRLCHVGLGECLRFGFMRCTLDGMGVECGAVAGEPSQEVCDDLDNDCDGLTDEGVCVACTPGEVRPCLLPGGGLGVMVCGEEAVFGPCQEAVAPSEDSGSEDASDGVETSPDLPDDSTLEDVATPTGPDLSADMKPQGAEEVSDIGSKQGAGGCSAAHGGSATLLAPWFLVFLLSMKRRSKR